MTNRTRSDYTLIHLSLWVMVFVLGSLELVAQRHFVRNFSAKDGLSQSEVGDMVQDRTGRLFITTASAGVDVFDGVSFQQLGIEDGLVSPYIDRIFKDSLGRLWFLSTEGINLYGQDSIQSFKAQKRPLGLESVFGVVELGPDHLLISSDFGLVEFKKGSFKFFSSGKLSSSRFFDILVDQKGRVLVISDDGLFEFQGDTVVRSQIGGGFPGENLLAIWESEEGELRLGTVNGFYSIVDERVEFHELFADKAYSVICFLESSVGDFYAGTNGQGLFVKRPGESEFEVMNEQNGLSDDFIWSLYEDSNAFIWVGTSGAGLDLLSANHFQIFNPDGGLANDIVYDIIERENGDIWFGVIQGGISVLSKNGYQHFGTEDGLGHLSIRCFHDEGDTLWIGTENGLTIYTDGRFQEVSELFQVKDYSIFDIHRDATGALWFACKGERYYGENGGVIRYSNGEISHYDRDHGLASNNIYCIHESSDGDILFGSTMGVERWEGDTCSPLLGTGSSPCHTTTLTMKEDYLSNLWIGTVGGLAVYRGDSLECLTGRPGLIGSTIYFLETQGDSILWVGSSSGLEKLDLKFFYENDSIKTILYNDFNGFYGTECNQNAVTIDRSGKYWFGTINGAVRYDPDQDRSDLRIPQIEISRINKRGQLTDWKELGFDLGQNGLPLNVELDHTENSVQIEFIGVSLLDSKSMEYSLLLAGADKDWSNYQKERSVFYSNLPPGEYSFHVRTRDANSGLVSKAAAYSFSITPAYYQTLWFKVLAISVLTLLVLGFFFWRIRSIRLKEAEHRDFQQQLAELEMTALRAQMNPHFLFNSLNSVNNFIIKNKKEEASEYLTKFSRLVRMVLQNSESKLVTLENELTALRLYIQMESLRFGGEFRYLENISEEVALEDILLPPLLLQPYVENAIWHGILHLREKKGELNVSIQKIPNGVTIQIEDNGVGREKAEFLKSKTAIKKKSMGMQINADRMGLSQDLYDFKIEVSITDLHSEGQASGTRVTIKLTES